MSRTVEGSGGVSPSGPEPPAAVARVAAILGLKLIWTRSSVAREGGRNVHLKYRIREVEGELVAFVGVGHRHLYWREPPSV